MAMEVIIPPNFRLSVIVILEPMLNLIVRYAEARLEERTRFPVFQC